MRHRAAPGRRHITRFEYLPCAESLAAYVALRHLDLARLQDELAYWGISPMGRSEARVLANIDAVVATLAKRSRTRSFLPM